MKTFAALLLALHLLTTLADGNPFQFFQPSLLLKVAERRQLDRGDPIVRVMQGNASQVAVFAALPIEIDGDRLVAWVRRIDALKKSPRVLGVGRFSDPPRIEDLAELSLDSGDLEEILSCKPDRCGLKLTGIEMSELQHVAARAGDNWRPMLQQAFRVVVLRRVNAYLAGGLAALQPYADHGSARARPATNFASILDHSVFLSDNLPELVEHLNRYPQAPMPQVESFVYWSQERLAGKPIISATHLSIVRNANAGQRMPDALVTGKQIFATHYLNASLNVTAIMRGKPGSPNYLVYLNRSDVDVLDGMWADLARTIIERRLKTEAVSVLRGLRERMQSGGPAPVE